MRLSVATAALLAACWGDNAYILEGVVVDKPSPSEVVVAHEEIEGFMPAMTMPFTVKDPALLAEVEPGDRIYGRLMVEDDASWLAKVRVVGKGAVPPGPTSALPPAPLSSGETLEPVEIPVHTGDTWVLGSGQGRSTLLSFVYTRCPLPEFCPATIARMQALQGALLQADDPAAGPRILLVTLDPDFDTLAVLAEYAEAGGADPTVWRMGRVEPGALATLASKAGLPVVRDGGEILHAVRTLVLDAEGRLVERYDDNHWPLERVVEQLRTGRPKAPPHQSGTVSPPPGR